MELGTELFIRSAEGLIPTDFSYKLYKRALSIIDEVDSIFSDAKYLPSNSRTLLNIGVGHGCCYTAIRHQAEFHTDHDDIVFNTKIASARNLLTETENGLLELIIGNEETLQVAKWLTLKKYVQLDRYMVARKEHPVFKEKKEKQLQCLQEYPYITYHLLEDSHGTKIPKAPIFRINDHFVLLDRLKNSDCYMLLSEELIHFLDTFNLALVGDSKIDTINFVIAYNEKTISEEGRSLLQYMLDQVGK